MYLLKNKDNCEFIIIFFPFKQRRQEVKTNVKIIYKKINDVKLK